MKKNWDLFISSLALLCIVISYILLFFKKNIPDSHVLCCCMLCALMYFIVRSVWIRIVAHVINVLYETVFCICALAFSSYPFEKINESYYSEAKEKSTQKVLWVLLLCFFFYVFVCMESAKKNVTNINCYFSPIDWASHKQRTYTEELLRQT